MDERREDVLAAYSGHRGPLGSLAVKAVEAAGETLPDPRRLDRIRSCCELLCQQVQLFRAQPVAPTLQNCKFNSLNGDLFPGLRSRHDATAGESLPLVRLCGDQGDLIRAKLRREKSLKLKTPPSPGRAYTADEKARMLAEARNSVARTSTPRSSWT